MSDDAVLLRRYAATRDPEAFAELVRRYAGLVYGACLRVTGNAHDAEDASQECFMELARHAGTVTSSLPGWLHVAATRRAVNTIRNAATRRRHEERATMAHDHAEPTWDEIAPHFDQALAELPEELRLPVALSFLQGCSQAEIADTRAAVKAAIDAGSPVLFNSEECSLLVGYEPVSKDNPTGWLYRLASPAANAPHARPISALPWDVCVVSNLAAAPPDRKDSIIWSLRTAVRNAHTPEYGGYSMGFAAWERWIKELGDTGRVLAEMQKELDQFDTGEVADLQLGNAWYYDNQPSTECPAHLISPCQTRSAAV